MYLNGKRREDLEGKPGSGPESRPRAARERPRRVGSHSSKRKIENYGEFCTRANFPGGVVLLFDRRRDFDRHPSGGFWFQSGPALRPGERAGAAPAGGIHPARRLARPELVYLNGKRREDLEGKPGSGPESRPRSGADLLFTSTALRPRKSAGARPRPELVYLNGVSASRIHPALNGFHITKNASVRAGAGRLPGSCLNQQGCCIRAIHPKGF